MTQKRTEVKIENFRKIDKAEPITSLGSCFASEIGKKMEEEGYSILNNPLGVLFNPASIASSLNRIAEGCGFSMEDVVKRDPHYGAKKGIENIEAQDGHRPTSSVIGGYTSFHHHGSFSRETPEEFLKNANDALEMTKTHFKASSVMIITFGTAWIYRHIERDIIVSNCHKHKASEFRREFLGVEQIVDLFRPIISRYKKDWIFTVSPIRHIKDGLHENQISKATLILAVDLLCKEFPNVHYFPSYEIVLDELRDYTNFASDLVHPSAEAINYVWKKWQQSQKSSTEDQ